MASTVTVLPATEVAVERLAGQLLETEPHTAEHWNRWGAYRLGIAVGAEIENQEQFGLVSEDDLNAAYLVNLSETARRAGAAVIVPPLDWGLRNWRQESRILCSAAQADHIDMARAGWHDVLQGLAAGKITLHDRRAANERFLRYAAFRRVG